MVEIPGEEELITKLIDYENTYARDCLAAVLAHVESGGPCMSDELAERLDRLHKYIGARSLYEIIDLVVFEK